MKRFIKTILAIATASSALTVMPANARDHDWNRGDWNRGHDRHYGGGDGISAGDIIAGALVIDGIAAIASSSNNGRYYDDRDSRYNNDDGWYRDGYGSRQAVDQCVRAAQNEARRYGWARVTDVNRIDRVRGGYEIRGRIVVDNRRYVRDWRGSDDRYGWHYDRYNDGYDKGRFTCVTRYGRVDDVNLRGLNYASRY